MHTAEKKEEENQGFKGKVVAFFDIEQDPLIKKFKEKNQPEEKKEEWEYSR